jgi:hypothetical protein
MLKHSFIKGASTTVITTRCTCLALNDVEVLKGVPEKNALEVVVLLVRQLRFPVRSLALSKAPLEIPHRYDSHVVSIQFVRLATCLVEPP